MKLDFVNNKTLEYKLPDGEFGTEPIFVPNPNGQEEDDGYILMQTIDGKAKKSNILILWAKNMVPEFKARAPGLGLFGLHSAFFPYEVGCQGNVEDCKPKINFAGKIQMQFSVLILTGFLLAFFG